MIPLSFAQIRRFACGALDLILPPRCIVTGTVVERQGMVASDGWGRLTFLTEPLCHCCGLPFPFGIEAGLCGACLQETAPFGQARAALAYDEGSREMILRFKHGDATHAVHSFAPWMQRAGAELLTRADVLVPVPLHRGRLIKRRYNQAALLAQRLTVLAGVPTVPDALVRQRATVSQGQMGRQERQANVRGAFAVHPGRAARIEGRRVLLIDDVLTTGATVGECAKVLKKAGAAEVDVLALARTVKAA